jgi:hypothetical protein
VQSCAAQLEHPGNKTKSSRARPKDRTPPARAARPLEPPGAGLTPGHFCVFQRAKLHCPCVKKQANLLESRYTYTRAVVCCGFWFMSQQPNRNFTLSLAKKSFSLMSNQLKPCGCCGKPDAPVRCGVCKQMRYCGKECQKSHWAARSQGQLQEAPHSNSRMGVAAAVAQSLAFAVCSCRQSRGIVPSRNSCRPDELIRPL